MKLMTLSTTDDSRTEIIICEKIKCLLKTLTGSSAQFPEVCSFLQTQPIVMTTCHFQQSLLQRSIYLSVKLTFCEVLKTNKQKNKNKNTHKKMKQTTNNKPQTKTKCSDVNFKLRSKTKRLHSYR